MVRSSSPDKKRQGKMSETSSFWWKAHAFSGALAVAFGAFGGHGLKARVEKGLLVPKMLEVWETATRYQFAHSLVGLLAVIMRNYIADNNLKAREGRNYAAAFAFVGNFLFCGSLYGMVLTDIKKLGAITPIGGTMYIVAWLCLAFDNYYPRVTLIFRRHRRNCTHDVDKSGVLDGSNDRCCDCNANVL